MNQAESVAKPDLLAARSMDPLSAQGNASKSDGSLTVLGICWQVTCSWRVSGYSTPEQIRLDGLSWYKSAITRGKTSQTHDNIPCRPPSPQPLCMCPGLPAEHVAAALQLYCSLLCGVSCGVAVTCEHSLNLRSGHHLHLPPLHCIYVRDRKRPSTGDMSQ